uniref:Uncharacterized protein n=1 Tax=Physcomitrium patens TaxID=3218 RepID=A0A2K1JKQ6_PHYPA|nr:hypothetical protein PHYPA_016962 [Physcomitrium patens]
MAFMRYIKMAPEGEGVPSPSPSASSPSPTPALPPSSVDLSLSLSLSLAHTHTPPHRSSSSNGIGRNGWDASCNDDDDLHELLSFHWSCSLLCHALLFTKPQFGIWDQFCISFSLSLSQ